MKPESDAPRRKAKTACQDGCPETEGQDGMPRRMFPRWKDKTDGFEKYAGWGGGGGSHLSLVPYVFVAECVGRCVGIRVTEYDNRKCVLIQYIYMCVGVGVGVGVGGCVWVCGCVGVGGGGGVCVSVCRCVGVFVCLSVSLCSTVM